MASDQIRGWLEQMRSLGYSEEQVFLSLRQQGWNEEQIRDLWQAAAAPPPTTTGAPATYAPASYAPPPPTGEPGLGLAALILGIAALVASPLAIVTGTLGVIFGWISLARRQPRQGMAIAGLVMAGVGLLLMPFSWWLLLSYRGTKLAQQPTESASAAGSASTQNGLSSGAGAQALTEPVSQVVPQPAATPPAQPWEQPGTQAGQGITGPDGGKMVWVPAGVFMMGTNVTGDYFKDARPAHQVRITQGFWLGKCTVTHAQYKQYCQETGASFPEGNDQGGNYPMGAVTWDQAQAYCQHYGLILPTEAQWEYAARGAEDRQYPWGNQWDPKKCNHSSNQGPDGHLMPVGSFPAGASWCGALDMAGNVWQWCQDWYGAKYYANSPQDDPPGPSTGTMRVRRGGSWVSDGDNCRSALRDYLDPPNPGSGFRCSMTP